MQENFLPQPSFAINSNDFKDSDEKILQNTLHLIQNMTSQVKSQQQILFSYKTSHANVYLR